MRTKQSIQRPARGARTAPARASRVKVPSPAVDEMQGMNPGLQGLERASARYAGRRAGFSVEDPLHDWPEDGAGEDDEWLLDREVQRPWGV